MFAAPPVRRVVIERDPVAHLWTLRCADPCEPEGWCMDMGDRRGCYLGGATSKTGAYVLATRWNYEVSRQKRGINESGSDGVGSATRPLTSAAAGGPRNG